MYIYYRSTQVETYYTRYLGYETKSLNSTSIKMLNTQKISISQFSSVMFLIGKLYTSSIVLISLSAERKIDLGPDSTLKWKSSVNSISLFNMFDTRVGQGRD